MREPSQRFWDAMIIKAWRDFKNTKDLYEQSIAEFGTAPWNLPLVRNKEMYGGVRAWVATRLPLLSEKLWVLPKERHIELLDWLDRSKMDCEISMAKNKTMKYLIEARTAFKKDEIKADQATWSYNLEKTINRNNQWTTTKGKIRR
jgi:hypothetical protein